jgi:hypothetical protein
MILFTQIVAGALLFEMFCTFFTLLILDRCFWKNLLKVNILVGGLLLLGLVVIGLVGVMIGEFVLL